MTWITKIQWQIQIQIQRQWQRQSQKLVTFETLITILTIVNLNSWQSLLPDNWEWHWTAFAILAMFFFKPGAQLFFSPSIFWFWQDQDKPKTSLRPDHDTTCEFLWKCFNWMQSAIKNWMTFIVGVDGDKREVSRRLKQEAAALGLH